MITPFCDFSLLQIDWSALKCLILSQHLSYCKEYLLPTFGVSILKGSALLCFCSQAQKKVPKFTSDRWVPSPTLALPRVVPWSLWEGRQKGTHMSLYFTVRAQLRTSCSQELTRSYLKVALDRLHNAFTSTVIAAFSECFLCARNHARKEIYVHFPPFDPICEAQIVCSLLFPP